MTKPLDQDQLKLLHNTILLHGLSDVLVGLSRVCGDIAEELAVDGHTSNAKVFDRYSSKLLVLSMQTQGN